MGSGWGAPVSPALAGFCEDGSCQQRIVPSVGPTTVGQQVALTPEQPPCRAPAARALQATRVQVPLQPTQRETIIQQLSNWKVDHTAIVPRLVAR